MATISAPAVLLPTVPQMSLSSLPMMELEAASAMADAGSNVDSTEASTAVSTSTSASIATLTPSCDAPLESPLLPPLPEYDGNASPRSPLDLDGSDSSCASESSHKRAAKKAPSNHTVTPSTIAVVCEKLASSPTIEQKKKSRKIHFAPSVRFREIRHLDDFEAGEIDLLWYAEHEYRCMKQEIKYTVQKMMTGQRICERTMHPTPNNNNNPAAGRNPRTMLHAINQADATTPTAADLPFAFPLCARGLEARTKAGARQRSRNKVQTRAAVLNEQDLQREEGFHDPEFIAMACMESTLDCRQGARARGLYDEIVIEDYMDDVKGAWAELRGRLAN